MKAGHRVDLPIEHITKYVLCSVYLIVTEDIALTHLFSYSLQSLSMNVVMEKNITYCPLKKGVL